MGHKFESLLHWFITFALLLVAAAAADTSDCTDGTYVHEGGVCCRCAAGTRLVTHCSVKPSDGKCEACDSGTYISYPNHEPTCEPCTSCSHPNDNLEDAESCTRARDAKCRCKKDHYCVSGAESCKLCHPCKKCGAEGIKVPCRGNSNTVCHDITEGSNRGIIAGIIVLILLVAVAAVGVFVYCRKKKSKRSREIFTHLGNGNADGVELQNLKVVSDVDLQPLLPDIAEVVGWTAMKDVARHTGMLNTAIENCMRDHPNNSKEQTLQLLMNWVESKGEKAHNTLIQTLVARQYNNTAKKVTDILQNAGR